MCGLIGYNLFATQCGIIFVTAVSSFPHHSHTPLPSHPQSGGECVRYGDLDLFLLGLQLGDLLPLFQNHRVKFSDLLSMTDRDLEQVRPQHSLSLSLPSLLASSLPTPSIPFSLFTSYPLTPFFFISLSSFPMFLLLFSPPPILVLPSSSSFLPPFHFSISSLLNFSPDSLLSPLSLLLSLTRWVCHRLVCASVSWTVFWRSTRNSGTCLATTSPTTEP